MIHSKYGMKVHYNAAPELSTSLPNLDPRVYFLKKQEAWYRGCHKGVSIRQQYQPRSQDI